MKNDEKEKLLLEFMYYITANTPILIGGYNTTLYGIDVFCPLAPQDYKNVVEEFIQKGNSNE